MVCFAFNQNSPRLAYAIHPSFDLRLALFFEEPLIRKAHSGWCPVLAARGVCVVLHTFASLGVPHHSPLTVTPLGLATQDFRLAPGTLFSPEECNLRGIGGGEFLTAQSRYTRCGIIRENLRGVTNEFYPAIPILLMKNTLGAAYSFINLPSSPS